MLISFGRLVYISSFLIQSHVIHYLLFTSDVWWLSCNFQSHLPLLNFFLLLWCSFLNFFLFLYIFTKLSFYLEAFFFLTIYLIYIVALSTWSWQFMDFDFCYFGYRWVLFDFLHMPLLDISLPNVSIYRFYCLYTRQTWWDKHFMVKTRGQMESIFDKGYRYDSRSENINHEYSAKDFRN